MTNEKLLNEIADYLYKELDPLGMKAIDSPRDEYLPEARLILKRVKPEMSTKDTQDAVYNIFVEMFDKELAGPPSLYESAAIKIRKILYEK